MTGGLGIGSHARRFPTPFYEGEVSTYNKGSPLLSLVTTALGNHSIQRHAPPGVYPRLDAANLVSVRQMRNFSPY